MARSTFRPDFFEYLRVDFFRAVFFFAAMGGFYRRLRGFKRAVFAYTHRMDNDVINEMNREEGVGEALGVDDDQRFEQLRRSHEEDAETDDE